MSRCATTRARRLTAVLAITALLLAGCGLPRGTEPKYVGPAPTAKPLPERAEQPPTPDGASDLAVLVSRYLATSVAGNVVSADQPDAVSETQIRMRTFMTEQAKVQWQPRPGLSVTVVRITPGKVLQQGDGSSVLPATLTPLYTLNRDGQLVSPLLDPNWSNTFTFRAEQVGSQLLLSAVPDGMLLSAEGLRDWYEPQPVYFWEKDVESPKLVPDLRYMPSVLSASKRLSEVVTVWLADGPSPWLNSVVDKVPTDLVIKDNPSVDDRTVVANLGSRARGKTAEDLRKVASQVRWSLPDHPPVMLTIENRKDAGHGSDGYDDDNAAVQRGDLDPEKFVVLDGVARQADIPPTGPVPLFADGEANTKVVSAAINRLRSKAALVRTVNGKQQLFVSAADTTAPQKYVETSIVGAALSRPRWINRPVQRFLISDGRKLYAVTPPANQGEAPKVDVVLGPNDTADTRITAFAVAPDGRRIAIIVDNTTKVAALQVENGRLKLDESKPVDNSLGANRSVGWFSETTLVIGGQADPGPPAEGRYSLISTSINGTGELPLPANGAETMKTFDVTQLSVRANDPLTSSPQTLIMFESNGLGQVVYNEKPGPVQLTQPGVVASPSPGQPAPLPKSPFYSD